METKDGNHIDQEIKLYRLGDEFVRYFNNYCYCGNPGYVGEENEEIVLASEILGGGIDDMYIAEIMGDSMIEAGLSKGDRAAISTTIKASPGDIVLALIDDEIVLKFLLLDEHGGTWLAPANPAYHPKKVDFSQYSNKIIGVMTKIIKEREKPDSVILKRFKTFLTDEYKTMKTTDDVSCEFYKYIPNDKDKKRVMDRLHSLLDGQEGVTVVKILKAALSVGYLMKMPSLGDLENEFSIVIANSVFYKAKHTNYDKKELQTFVDSLF